MYTFHRGTLIFCNQVYVEQDSMSYDLLRKH